MNIPIRARKIMAILTVITMLASFSSFMPVTPVYASSVWTVNDANDTAGSATNVTMRYALSHAQSGDIINFADNIIGQCYYTMDGSDPRISSTRIAYNGLIPLDQSGTIKAANHTSAGWSDVKTASFTIGGSDSPREPIIFPFEGNYSSAQTVYIYSPGADWLYYTTDGTDPGTSSTGTYFQGCFTSVLVSQTMTIRAIAGYGSGSSNIAEAHLSIGGSGPLTEPVITPNGGSYSGPLLVDISNKAGTIYLSSPLPKIDKDLTISGPGAESLAISGNYQTRVLEIIGGNVLISGLTIENGWVRGNTGFDGNPGIAGGGGGGGGAAEGGGGMLVKGGTITIDGVNFSNNQAIGGSGGNGGAGYTGEDDYGDGGNGAVSDLIDGSTGGRGGIAPFSAVDFGIFHLSDARPGYYALDGFRYGGGGGGSGLNSNNEDTYHSVGGLGGQDVNGTNGVGPNGVGYNTNGNKGGNGGTGGYAHIESFNNSYYGGNGGNGGDAYGGALCLISGAVQINNSSFTGNTVLGGTGGAGGISYQGFSNGQTLDSFIFSIGSTMLSGNRGEFESWWKLVDFGLSRVGNAFAYETKSSTAYPYGGYPGNGGNAEGGAVYLSPYNSSFGWGGAPLVMVNCSFNGNGAYGGYPGPMTNWTGVSGSFGQEFASDIANKTNSAHVDIRNVTGADSNLGDIRELSQPSVTWSEIEANNIKATCGTDVVTIQVNLRDSNSLAVWGEKVILNQGGGHSQISPSYAITDNNGNATFTVVGTKAETVEYTAVCASSNITVSGKPFMLWDGSKNVPWTESRVIFSPGPPNAQTSTVSASHSTITADGVSAATITVNIADAGGNILSGKQVTLNQGAGHSIITPATATTDNSGNATFTVTNVYDEFVTYAASVGSITVSQTVGVTFSQYAWVVDNLGDGQSPGTLRYAVGNAPPGTTIVFAAGLSGSIDLYSPLPKINKDLTIDGTGANVAVNGKNLYRIFEINGGTVSIKGIALVNGRAKGNDGAYGGTSSQYSYGISGESGLSGLGGGLLITNGTVSVDNVDFINNKAQGGDGGNGGNATGSGPVGGAGGTAGNGGVGQGGAIYLTNGTLTVTNSTFTDSSAIGGRGGTGGNGSCYGGEGGIGADGNGGAIYVNAGSLTITNIQFTNNSATGGNGGNGGGGGNTTAGEHGFGGGNGWGGALYINSGTFTATDCQFLGSAVAGGTLGTGNHGSIGSAGTAVGKDIFIKNCTTSLNNVTFSSDTNSYVNLTPADAGQSDVTASPASIAADGISKSTIKVTLRCANGIPAVGKNVSLIPDGGNSNIIPINSSITDSKGEVTFTVSDTVGETVTYTAKDTTDNITVTMTKAVTFQPPDAGQSTVIANPSNVVADGNEMSTITVALKYSNGNPAVGKTVVLSAGSGSSIINQTSAVTDNNGTATFTVTDIHAQTVVYTVRDTTDNITVSQTATVTFTPYSWKVNTLNDGNSLGTLRYAIQNAPAGATITFQGALAGTLALTSPLPVISKDLTIDGSGANVTISGNDQYRVFKVDSGTVTIKDLTIANGKVIGEGGADRPYDWRAHPIVNDVSVSGGNGSDMYGGGLLVMNGTVSLDGVTFIDNKAIGGNGGLGDNGCGIYNGGIGGTGGNGKGGAIFVSSGSLSVINSQFSGNYASGGNGGNGGSAYMHGGNGGTGGSGNGGAIFVNSGSLTIEDSQFSSNSALPGNGGIGGSSYYNGANGGLGSAIGNDIYIRNCTVAVSNVIFDPGFNSFYNSSPADAGKSTVTANPTDIMADGIATSTITVTLKDANGAPLGSGKTVILSQGAVHSNITPVNNGLTDVNGSAAFIVTDTYAENVIYTATDSTDNVTLTQTAVVNFISPDAGKSTVTTNNASVTADGSEASIITVTLLYSNGNPAIGKTVKISQGTGSSIISPSDTAITDNNGIANFSVTSLKSETVTYTITDTTDNMTVTQQATVIFSAYSWKVKTLNDGSGVGTLRYAMQNAPAGSTITFQNGLAGTLILASPLPAINKDLTFDGTGASVTISGNNYYRIFQVDGGTVSFNNLTIANGRAVGNDGANANGGTGNGGGVLVTGGTVTINGVTFRNNNVNGGYAGISYDGGSGYGGAIYVVNGSMFVSNSNFSSNSANGGGGGWGNGLDGGTGGNGCGGAIYINDGSLAIENSIFNDNRAAGGFGGYGGTYGSSVNGNNGGYGGNGGNGFGGAIFINSGTFTLDDCNFSGNFATSGSSNTGTLGSGSMGTSIGRDLYNQNGTDTLSNVKYYNWSDNFYNLSSSNTVAFSGGLAPNIINSAVSIIDAPVDPVLSGYRFEGWYKEPDCINEWDFSTDTVTGDIILYAKWTATYSVTFNLQNGGQVTLVNNVLSGSVLNEPAAPIRTGYTFGGWYKDSYCTYAWDFSTDTVTYNLTLYAKWTALPRYTVTFVDTQSSSPVPSINNVIVGFTINEPTTPTWFGHVFGGWYKEAACINAWNFDTDTVTGDICLYAKWTALPTYMVTFNSQGGTPALSTNSIYSGYTVSEPAAPTKSGSNFGGWYKEPECTNAWNFSIDTVTCDTILYAKWTALPTYTVTFNSQGGSAVSSTNNVISGSTISAPADPARAGYIFGGWYKEQACTNVWNFGTDTVTSDITLYAKWTPIYNVTFDSQGGSPVSSANDVISGSTISEPSAPTQAGYVFGGWYKEQACTNVWDFATDTVTSDITLYAKWTQTFSVTFMDWDGTVLKTETVNEGSAATAPTNLNRSGFTFTGWDKDFSNVTSDLTATALYSYSGGGGSSSNEISTAPETPKTETSVSGNTVTSTTSTTAKIDNNGNATAEITLENVSDAVDEAVAEAAKQGESTVANVEIKVTAPENAKTVEISIPKAAVSEIGGHNISSLEVSTPIASISFDKNALDSICQAAVGDIKIAAAEIDPSALPENTRQVVGDRPVFEFSVKSGDNPISQFDGTVRVSVPYTPKTGEDTNAIVIYYINAEGRLELVSNCAYDPVTGNITFATSHFSQYAIGYNKVSFADVPAEAWYSKAVEFIAARGITLGTGNGIFSPKAKLTRGEFIVMMMRAYGIAPDTNSKDNFADAGNTHFTGYLAAAKRLGISEGVGNNRFAPEKEITRQEMFTLMYNVLKVVADLPSGTSGKQLSSFTDTGLISTWAKDAMKLFVETGIISGNGGRLSPTSTSTRAELAQVLYILLLK